MSQSSWMWDTNGTGDGAASGVTEAQWHKLLRLLGSSAGANQGTFPAYNNGLLVSNPAGTTIRVATGAALVHGAPYENDAQTDFTPGDGTYPGLPTNNQIHRVVLQKSWAAQTVRIAFISGTDDVSPSTPSLTQTDNTTWEIPLYQFQISSAGAISNAVDQRESLDAVGNLIWFLNESINAKMTRGLTINQGTADDEILALKSSDVTHGMTDVAETDTYGSFDKLDGAKGGLRVRGLSDTTSSPGLHLLGLEQTADTSKGTGSNGAVTINGAKKSGTSIASLGADGNILVVADNGTTRFILDSDGDSHQDVGTAWTNFDEQDDLALLHALSAGVAREDDPVRHNFATYLQEHRQALQAARIVTFNEEDGHHFINWSRTTMLLLGAVRQLGQRLQVAEARLAALPAAVQD